MNDNNAMNCTSSYGSSEGKIIPRTTDVLCGRIGRPKDIKLNSGTKLFRDLVKAKQEEYAKCPEKFKKCISQSIVQTIREQGRRFLAKREHGAWDILGDNEAIRKTSQALREKQPITKRKHYRNSRTENNETNLPTVKTPLDLRSTPAAPVTLQVSQKWSQEIAALDSVVEVATATSSLPHPSFATLSFEQPQEQNGTDLSHDLPSPQEDKRDDLSVKSFGISFEDFLSPQAIESSILRNDSIAIQENDVDEFSSSSAALSTGFPQITIPYQQQIVEYEFLYQYHHHHSQQHYTIPPNQRHFPQVHSFNHSSEDNPNHRESKIVSRYDDESSDVTYQQPYELSTNDGHLQQLQLQSPIPKTSSMEYLDSSPLQKLDDDYALDNLMYSFMSPENDENSSISNRFEIYEEYSYGLYAIASNYGRMTVTVVGIG